MAQSGTVAVLGAGGTMGFPMARNIARAGTSVRAWNRSRDKAEPLAAEGAVIADSPVEAARGAGVGLTMLADENAIVAAMDGPDGALSAMSGAVWLQMSTIGEEATRRCAELANRHGVGFVDAPVLGTRKPALEGKLVILESGPEEARPRTRPIFGALGRTIRVGEAGAGSRLKLVTNSWILAVVEAGAETIAMAEGLDLDPGLFFQAIEGSSLDLPYLRMKGKAMMERNFTPAMFRLKLAAKDGRLMRDAAHSRGLDLPLVDAIARRLDEGASEHPDEDLSATLLTSVPERMSTSTGH
jgi:3-hydroxyisobutyrate dehydrogenase